MEETRRQKRHRKKKLRKRKLRQQHYQYIAELEAKQQGPQLDDDVLLASLEAKRQRVDEEWRRRDEELVKKWNRLHAPREEEQASSTAPAPAGEAHEHDPQEAIREYMRQLQSMKRPSPSDPSGEKKEAPSLPSSSSLQRVCNARCSW